MRPVKENGDRAQIFHESELFHPPPFLSPAKSLIALCTSSFSMTARCRLDLVFAFPFARLVDGSSEGEPEPVTI